MTLDRYEHLILRRDLKEAETFSFDFPTDLFRLVNFFVWERSAPYFEVRFVLNGEPMTRDYIPTDFFTPRYLDQLGGFVGLPFDRRTIMPNQDLVLHVRNRSETITSFFAVAVVSR